MDFFIINNVMVNIPLGEGGYALSWIEAIGTVFGLLCIWCACGEAIIFALIGDATNSSSNQQWRDLRGNLGILHCAEKNDLKMIFLHWILHLNDFRLNRFKSTFNHCPNS